MDRLDLEVTNKSKEKGTRAESDFVKYCRDVQGLRYVERRSLNGSKDRGDIAGIPGVVVELKAAVTLRIPQWKAEVLQEVNNDKADLGVLVVKVPRKGVAQWDAWVPAWMLGWFDSRARVDAYRNRAVWFRMSVEDLFLVLRTEGYIS